MEKKRKLLTASDVAGYLNVSEHTVYRWCRNDKIPHFNLDSTYRFEADEIEKWLKSKHRLPTTRNGNAKELNDTPTGD